MLRSENRQLAIAVTVLGLFLATSPAEAIPGDKDSAELGIYLGQGFLDDYGGSEPDDDLLYGVRLGSFMSKRFSFEISYQQLAAENDAGTSLDIISYRGNALYNLMPERQIRPFFTAGLGLETTELGSRDSNDGSLNAGGGVRWYLSQNIGLRFDGRYVYTDVGAGVDEGQGNIEATLGVVFGWGGGPPPDTDRDGVPDRKDKCPGTPEGAVVDERGCPLDGDGDLVFDGLDRCPDTGAGCPVDADGCPLDSDGDGVIDCKDTCADTVKGCTIDAAGCPVDEDGDGVCDGIDTCAATPQGCAVDAKGCPLDSDGDKVIDCQDTCPETVTGCTVDATGCPKDEDSDGVCDGLDQCPGTPAGRTVDAKGCEALFERGDLVLEGVSFGNDSADLAGQSAVILDSVAASLRAWSEVQVEIEGHTDGKGSESYNQKLSQKRADSVRDYLVRQGVDPARLTAKGYGESQPIADNATEEGRTRNRRVELKKLN